MLYQSCYRRGVNTYSALIQVGEIFCCWLPVLVKTAIYNLVCAVAVQKHSVFVCAVEKLRIFHSEDFFPRCFETILDLDFLTIIGVIPQLDYAVVNNGIIRRRDFFVIPLLGINIFRNFYLRKFHAVIGFCEFKCLAVTTFGSKLFCGCFLAVNLVYYFNILRACCRSCCESHFAGGFGIVCALCLQLPVNTNFKNSHALLKDFISSRFTICVVSALAFKC